MKTTFNVLFFLKRDKLDKPEHTDHLKPEYKTQNCYVKLGYFTDNTADTDHFYNLR
jgi:hypothetical protein